MGDSLLRNAFLISSAIHLVLLLTAPAPPRPSGSSSLRVEVLVPPAAPAPEPEPPVDSHPPPPELAKADVGNEDVWVEPEPAAPAPLERAPARPEPEEPSTGSDLPSPSADLEMPSPSSEAIPAESPAPNAGEATTSQEFDPAAARSLLAELREEKQRDDSVARYRFEVRERVREVLAERCPGAELLEGNEFAYRFRLGFRVTRDGMIYDLSLRAPPDSKLDLEALRHAVFSLSPLPPPPDSTATSFRWLIIY